jgi:hypothetical protein
MVETNSQILVKAMNTTEFDRTPEGIIYQDLCLYMQMHFNSVNVSFAPRICNKLAHVFAAYGASRQELKLLWADSLPVDVRVLVDSISAEPSI